MLSSDNLLDYLSSSVLMLFLVVRRQSECGLIELGIFSLPIISTYGSVD